MQLPEAKHFLGMRCALEPRCFVVRTYIGQFLRHRTVVKWGQLHVCARPGHLPFQAGKEQNERTLP